LDASEIEGAKRFSSEEMQRVPLLATERATVSLHCFEPGQSEAPHTHHDADKVYHVLEGRGRITVGSEVATHGVGVVVIVPAGVRHGAENDSADRLVLLVVLARDLAPGVEVNRPPEG
jgi:quercetin dioxygenase-like cupin family protein